MRCKIGKEEHCKSHGCEWEKNFFFNCKDHDEIPIQQVAKKCSIKKKQKVLKKSINPIPDRLKTQTRQIYDRSNGTCYKCGEPIKSNEFRIHNSLIIGYSHKKNNKKLSIPIMRASHKECKKNKI